MTPEQIAERPAKPSAAVHYEGRPIGSAVLKGDNIKMTIHDPDMIRALTADSTRGLSVDLDDGHPSRREPSTTMSPDVRQCDFDE